MRASKERQRETERDSSVFSTGICMVPRLPTSPALRRRPFPPASWLPQPAARPLQVAHVRKLLGGGPPAPQGGMLGLLLAVSGTLVVALVVTMLALYLYRQLKPAKHA